MIRRSLTTTVDHVSSPILTTYADLMISDISGIESWSAYLIHSDFFGFNAGLRI